MLRLLSRCRRLVAAAGNKEAWAAGGAGAAVGARPQGVPGHAMSSGGDRDDGGVGRRLREGGFSEAEVQKAFGLNLELGTYSHWMIDQRLEYLDYVKQSGVFDDNETVPAYVARQPWVLEQRMEEVFVDHEYVVVNKPFDMRIDIPRGGEKKWPNETTVASWVSARHSEVPPDAPKFCNQIDYGTSGIVVIAKDKKSAKRATGLFRPVGPHPTEDFQMAVVPGAKESLTRAQVLERGYLALGGAFQGRAVTKLLVRPHTGRRHQIRVHLAHLGFPIVGDMQYSEDRDSFRMFRA